MEHLWAPWRSSYVKEARRLAEAQCLFCVLGTIADPAADFLLHRSDDLLVVLNRYPYTTGHLLVAPRSHWASPSDAPATSRASFYEAVVYAERALRRAYRPDGLNVGMNLGEAAGAGVPAHFHMHVVCRWAGDTNFMASVASTRVHPESLVATHARLAPFFEDGWLSSDHPLFHDAQTGPRT